MRRYGLRDDQFSRIENFLPGRPGSVGRDSQLGNRVFVEAVIWKFRSGAPWRDLPERFGDWKNTHRRFSRWAQSGVWERLFEALADDPDNEYAMIDATIVRAHQHSAGAKKRRPRPSHRPFQRRPDDENPCHRRCSGKSAGTQPDPRTGPRHHAGRNAGRSSHARSAPRRQGLRQRHVHRQLETARHQASHPAQGQPQGQTRL